MPFVRRGAVALVRNLGVLRTPIATNASDPCWTRVSPLGLHTYLLRDTVVHVTHGNRLPEGISMTQATTVESDPKFS